MRKHGDAFAFRNYFPCHGINAATALRDSQCFYSSACVFQCHIYVLYHCLTSRSMLKTEAPFSFLASVHQQQTYQTLSTGITFFGESPLRPLLSIILSTPGLLLFSLAHHMLPCVCLLSLCSQCFFISTLSVLLSACQPWPLFPVVKPLGLHWLRVLFSLAPQLLNLIGKNTELDQTTTELHPFCLVTEEASSLFPLCNLKVTSTAATRTCFFFSPSVLSCLIPKDIARWLQAGATFSFSLCLCSLVYHVSPPSPLSVLPALRELCLLPLLIPL